MLSRKNMLRRFLWLLVASATGLASWCDLFAQVNHSYPRTAVFHFGNDAPAYWYAKFDLVDVRSTRTSLPKAIKAINPNTYVFGTKDWNNGSLFKPTPTSTKRTARTDRRSSFTAARPIILRSTSATTANESTASATTKRCRKPPSTGTTSASSTASQPTACGLNRAKPKRLARST